MKTLAVALAAFALAGLSGAAFAKSSVCTVADPTSTDLNVRAQPAGEIIWTLPNGYQVSPQDSYTDRQGRVWLFISEVHNGDPIGWVFRKYLRCS